MKKAYIYFLAPLVGVAIFGVVFWNYNAQFQAREAEAAKKVRAQAEERIRKDNEGKKKALEDAIAASEKRKAEKAAKDLRDQKERDDREAAVIARTKARQDASKLGERAKALARDIEENKKEIETLNADKKLSLDEEAFLREHVKKAEANVQNLYGVLEKIDAADKAMEAAAKAAAAAAAKK